MMLHTRGRPSAGQCLISGIARVIALATMLSAATTSFGQAVTLDFESYSPGSVVFTDLGASGGEVVAGSNGFALPGTQALRIGGDASRLTSRISLNQSGITGDVFTLQWDARVLYEAVPGVGSASNQVGFLRWGADTNVLLSLRPDAAGQQFSLLRWDGGSLVDFASAPVWDRNQWHTLRLEYESGSTTQRLFMDNDLIFEGNLLYGSTGPPLKADTLFFQQNTVSQTQDLDNVFFAGGTGPLGNTRSPTFGQDWVRSNPFMLQSVLTLRNAKQGPAFVDAGLNIANAPIRGSFQDIVDLGVGYHAYVGDGYTSPDSNQWFQDVMTEIATVSGVTGIIIGDEPDTSSEFADMAVVLEAARNQRPDLLVYSTIYALPDDLVDEYITTVRPDVLLYDDYPFQTSNPNSAISSYFSTLMRFRAKAQQHNLPLFSWMQTFATAHWRAPSETEVRMQAFSSLTAGVQGLTFFTLAASDYGGFTTAMLDPFQNNPTPIFYAVQEMTPEIANLGRSLRFLRSTDVRYLPGNNGLNPTPSGLTDWIPGAGADLRILDIDIVEQGTSRNGMIGFFRDDDDNLYFMLTNLVHGSSLSDHLDPSVLLTFQITLDPGVTEVWRLNRQTGNPELMTLTGNMLEVTLAAGTGDLFSFNSNFPVPEPMTALYGAAGVLAWLIAPRRRSALPAGCHRTKS